MKRLKEIFVKPSATDKTNDDIFENSFDFSKSINRQRNRNKLLNVWESYKLLILCTSGVLIFVLYNIYLVVAIIYKDSMNVNWCHGIKIILLITFISYGYLFYYKVIKVLIKRLIWNYFKGWGGDKLLKKIFKYPIVHLICFASIAIYALVVSVTSRETFVSYAGIWILLLLGFTFSRHHTKIKWRQVFWGLNLQFLIGLLFLHYETPSQIFYCLSDKLRWIGDQVNVGAVFVFGFLISGDFQSNENFSLIKLAPLHAFQMFCEILVFSTFVGILHHYKINKYIICHITTVFYFVFGTNAVESVVAITTIFFGFKDSIMFIRHYVPFTSHSELFSICTLGMVTNSGALYGTFRHDSSFGVHHVTANLMSIASALTMMRLIYPEIDDTRLNDEDIEYISNNVAVYNNIGESIVCHIFDAIQLSGGIIGAGMVFALFPFMLDEYFEWFATMAGIKIDLIWVLTNALRPFVYIVGIKWEECFDVAKAIATKLMYEELKAFKLLNASNISKRSQALAIYLLNDSANVIHLAFNIATISILVPTKLPKFVSVLTRSFFTAISTSWLTACIAGCLMTFTTYKESFEFNV